MIRFADFTDTSLPLAPMTLHTLTKIATSTAAT
jgi:hypothetical protein